MVCPCARGAGTVDPDLHGTGYLLTASLSALGGYAVAAMRYAPRIAELARRVEVTERSLTGHGAAIEELCDALRSVLGELDTAQASPSQREAIAAARWVLARR